MTFAVGDRLPDVPLLRIGKDGPESVALGDRLKGRKVALFGLPGAYTSTCTMAHVPSFIRTKAGFDDKGVDEIICIAVNDPFVMKAWGEATGATAAGITMLADGASEFTRAVGMEFSVPGLGFYDRCQRFALYAEDGVIKVLNIETARGSCDISGGEALLAAI
jgi:glutaredoxin/glutathione-dependent peroxiredoxin